MPCVLCAGSVCDEATERPLVRAEVERYKEVADVVRAATRGRSHSPEDDIVVHKKAHAIINCFIDSAVTPRVQVWRV